ncbi:hypothetical protein AGMMS50262_04830 [Bacteroidia bacterium]|nr:hypothetical protein AGMMS50262_04830 [Bacteroidia bacterium]
MKKIYLLIIPILAVCLIHSCTEGFETANTNPNKTQVVYPEFLFGLSPVQVMRTMGSDVNWFFFGNYTNQLSVVGGTGPHFGKDGRADNIFRRFYTEGLNPVIYIEKMFGDNPSYANRVAIAKIWKSYIFSQLTAIYGPVPYFDACNEGPTMRYDREDTIYVHILKDLKDAYTTLETNPTGDIYPEGSEPFLNSSLTRWAQFAHCIRLRVAMRLTEVDEKFSPGLAQTAQEMVKEELDNADNKLLIKDNTENFFMNWGMEEVNQNPYYKGVLQDPALETNDPGNYPVIHESFIMWTSPSTYNDPCLAAYMYPATENWGTPENPSPEYFGRPYANGSPQGFNGGTGWSNPYDKRIPFKGFATLGKEFSMMTAKWCFFTYPELACYRAEAAYKGWWKSPADAEKYYNEAIDARCDRFGAKAADVKDYKALNGIKWGTATDTATVIDPDYGDILVNRADFHDYLGGIINSYLGVEDNYKRIILQEWLNFFYQGIDCWTMLRRTQVLEFKPHWNADISSAYVNGYYAYMPNRLQYPGSEISKNATEVQKAIDNLLLDNTLKEREDQITFRLIFCKDYDGLKQVPLRQGNDIVNLTDFRNNARNRK